MQEVVFFFFINNIVMLLDRAHSMIQGYEIT